MSAETPAPSKALEPAALRGGEQEMILTFRLQGEIFALDVACVNEILDPIPQTRVPNADPFAPALINVRGTVTPLIDIRHRLGMAQGRPDEDARFVVLDLTVAGQPTRLAVSVDSVEEVLEADRATLEAIPELGARWPADFIDGVAKHGEELVVLLKTETLFDPKRQARAA